MDSYGIFADNNLLVKSFVDSDTNEHKNYVYGYNTSIAEFLSLDKDKYSKEIEEANEMIANNKIKLKLDDIVTPLNPDNIKDTVDTMSIPDIDIYEEFLSKKIDEEFGYRFKLIDLTGDNRDELIVESFKDDFDLYNVYGITEDKVYFMCGNPCDDFRIFDDNSIIFVTEYSNQKKKFEYYEYNRDIRRFYMEKAGEYREGDLEYLDKLLEKKVKLTGDDIDTELTKENLDAAFGD